MSELDGFGRPATGTVVTIGAYDGVHLGHRALIGLVRSLATERGLASVVLTFDRHPASIVRPESAPRLLCDLDQKLELLAATGIDHVVVLPFDLARSQEEAEEFVAEVLVGALDARVVAVGEDFHFGRGRRGSVALLEALGRSGPSERGGRGTFEVVHIDLLRRPDGAPVSSTAVRGLLGAGDVAGAAELLGRPYEVRGLIVPGEGRGHDLGFPTANVSLPPDVLVPANAIYAGWCTLPPDPVPHPTAISVGVRPTFHPGCRAAVVIEAYLLDFDGDLYGRPARVRFVTRLREELRFESAHALVKQMALDVEATRAALAGPG